MTLIAAALSIGCGGASDSAEKSRIDSAAITSRGVQANQCAVTATFDIVAPTDIQFVAIDRSQRSEVYAALYTVDENGTETRVNQEATKADERTQAMLDASSNKTNDSNSSEESNSERSAHESASSSSDSEKHGDSSSENGSSGSSQSSTDSAHSDQHQDSHTDASNNQGSGNSGNSSNNSNTNSSGNQSSDSNNSSNQTSQNNNANQSQNNSSSDKDTTTKDSSSKSSDSNKGSNHDSSTSADKQNQANSKTTSTEALTFDKLEVARSRHLVLRIDMKSDDSKAVLRVYQGGNQGVTATADMSTNTPGCK